MHFVKPPDVTLWYHIPLEVGTSKYLTIWNDTWHMLTITIQCCYCDSLYIERNNLRYVTIFKEACDIIKVCVTSFHISLITTKYNEVMLVEVLVTILHQGTFLILLREVDFFFSVLESVT